MPSISSRTDGNSSLTAAEDPAGSAPRVFFVLRAKRWGFDSVSTDSWLRVAMPTFKLPEFRVPLTIALS
jgi:hypothetical protein